MIIPYIDINNYELKKDIVSMIPFEVAVIYDLITLDNIGKILVVSIPVENNYDKKQIRELKYYLSNRLKYCVQFVSSKKEDIKRLMNQYYKEVQNA